jgi:hypothetical protein
MPPFDYSPYRNPYVDSIAESIAAPGRIRAAGVQQVGAIEGQAAQQRGAIWGQALNQIGQIAQQTGQTLGDPVYIARQRALKYDATAVEIAKSLGDNATPESATALMTKAGIPITYQEPILKSMQSMLDLRKEGYAEAAHIAYQMMLTLPKGASTDQRAHAVAAGLGAAMAAGQITPQQSQHVTQMLGEGVDPMQMTLGVMGQAPSKRYQKIIDDETSGITTPDTSTTFTPSGRVLHQGEARKGNSQPATFDVPGIGNNLEGSYVPGANGAPGQFFYRDPTTNTDYDVTGRALHTATAAVQNMRELIEINKSRMTQTPYRPTPAEAAVKDPITGRTAGQTFEDAVNYSLKNTTPYLGLGTAIPTQLARNDIDAKAAALELAAGVDRPTLQAEYKAYSGALTRQVTLTQNTAASAGAAKDNLQLALDQSQEVGRSDVKYANKYLQWAQSNFTDSKDLSKLELYIYTAAREYAKVVSGSALSSQGLTDTAAAEVSKLLGAAQSPDVFRGVAEGMQKDMDNVTTNQYKLIGQTSEVIANFLRATYENAPVAGPQAAPVPPPPPAAPGPAAAPSAIPQQQGGAPPPGATTVAPVPSQTTTPPVAAPNGRPPGVPALTPPPPPPPPRPKQPPAGFDTHRK